MIVQQVFDYLTDPVNYRGPAGIDDRLLQHVRYCVLSLLIAVVVAVPVGALIGHTRRGAALFLGTATALRALPSLGVLFVLASAAVLGRGLPPLIITLAVLAVPPVMLATLAGVAGVAVDTVDAARGVGMTEAQVLIGVELPNALPVLFGGVRTAMLQVVATAPIAALIGLETLGQYVVAGLAQRDVPQVAAGAVLIAVLAIVFDILLAALQRLLVPTGLRTPAGPRRTPVSLLRGPAGERTVA